MKYKFQCEQFNITEFDYITIYKKSSIYIYIYIHRNIENFLYKNLTTVFIITYKKKRAIRFNSSY